MSVTIENLIEFHDIMQNSSYKNQYLESFRISDCYSLLLLGIFFCINFMRYKIYQLKCESLEFDSK